MSDMEERVAKAMLASSANTSELGTWEQITDGMRDWYRKMARVAIGTIQYVEPRSCQIDGVTYGQIPVYHGEPAFLGDGGPNADFDWKGWSRARDIESELQPVNNPNNNNK